MFDEAKAQKTLRFIENLKHTKGIWHGQNFKLLPWREEIIRTIFGTVKENGYRQYNTAYIEIPKKNGKSELAEFMDALPTGSRRLSYLMLPSTWWISVRH